MQDAAAQYAAVLLDARAGQRVWMRCRTGGKTAHMLERADLDLTALDNDEARLPASSPISRASRLAQTCLRRRRSTRSVVGWQAYDAILADVVFCVRCRATHPDVKWLRRENDIARFAERQRELLESLWRLLATDGKLLYATCSVFQDENPRTDRMVPREASGRATPHSPRAAHQRTTGAARSFRTKCMTVSSTRCCRRSGVPNLLGAILACWIAIAGVVMAPATHAQGIEIRKPSVSIMDDAYVLEAQFDTRSHRRSKRCSTKACRSISCSSSS